MSVSGAPSGLGWFPDFVSNDEQLWLLENLRTLDWNGKGRLRRMGNIVKRREIDFLHNYGRHNRKISPGSPLPPFLEPIRERCGAACGIDPRFFQQVIAAKYAPGAGIDWHVDSTKAFGEPIVSVSLASAWVMQFRPIGGGALWSLVLA